MQSQTRKLLLLLFSLFCAYLSAQYPTEEQGGFPDFPIVGSAETVSTPTLGYAPYLRDDNKWYVRLSNGTEVCLTCNGDTAHGWGNHGAVGYYSVGDLDLQGNNLLNANDATFSGEIKSGFTMSFFDDGVNESTRKVDVFQFGNLFGLYPVSSGKALEFDFISGNWEYDGTEISTGVHFSPSTLLADYSFTDNSTNWNNAFGWGDWSTGVDTAFIEGIDAVTSPDVIEIDKITQAAYDALAPPVSTTLYIIVN